MRPVWIVLALVACESSPYDPDAARRSCLGAAECWVLARLLAEDPAGEAAVDALLADDAVSAAAKRDLVWRLAPRRPDWVSTPARWAMLTNRVAAAPDDAALGDLPIALHLRVVAALDAQGVALRLPFPDVARRYLRPVAARDHHQEHAAFCELGGPVLDARMARGEATLADARALLRYRCADTDAALDGLARLLDAPAGRTLRESLAGGAAPSRHQRDGGWAGCVHLRRPWARVRAFLEPAISCETGDAMLAFAEGPYRIGWPQPDKHAFVEAVIDWRGRCDTDADWGVFIRQLGDALGAAVQAAHAPESLACDRVHAALKRLRSGEFGAMPRSVAALARLEAGRCASR